MSELGKGSCFPSSALVISETVLFLIHHPLQSLAVPPSHPEDDRQGNQSMELLESLEERVAGQPQQDTSHVCLPQQFWAVDQRADK